MGNLYIYNVSFYCCTLKTLRTAHWHYIVFVNLSISYRLVLLFLCNKKVYKYLLNFHKLQYTSMPDIVLLPARSHHFPAVSKPLYKVFQFQIILFPSQNRLPQIQRLFLKRQGLRIILWTDWLKRMKRTIPSCIRL